MVALTQQLLSQHFASSNFQAMSTPSASGSEASSGLPPAKRAKVMKTPSINDIDFDKLALSSYKLGNGTTSYSPLLDGVKARFDLTPPGTLVFSTWGFETNFKLNPEKKPSFLGGPATNKNEFLSINVELTPVQSAIIEALDAKLGDEFRKTSKANWHSAVKVNHDGVAMLKVRVQMTGVEQTAMKVVDGNSFAKGSGWQFLQPWMAKTRNFGPCKAKLVLVASRIWEMGGRAGLFFQAAEATLMSVAVPRLQFESAQEDEDAMMADFASDDV